VRAYRGQALVTRTVSFDAVAGPQQVVVADLPSRLVPESLYATGDDNLTIRATRFRASALKDSRGRRCRRSTSRSATPVTS